MLLVLSGALLGAAGVLLAARRALVQPVPYDAALEEEFVALVEQFPHIARTLDVAVTNDLVCAHDLRGRLSVARASSVEASDPDVSDQALPGAHDPAEVPEDVRARYARMFALLSELHDDRVRFRGAADWLPGEDGVPVRRLARPSAARLALFVLLGAASGFVASLQDAPAAVAAVLLLGFAATVVSAVDADTLLIDFVSLWGAGGVALLLAASAAVSSGGVAALWPLLWSVALVGGLLLLVGMVFFLLRGVQGIGAGDLVVIPVAFGTPVLLTGELVVVSALLWVASTSAVVGHVVRAVRTGAGRASPLAFGPHLMWAHLPVILFAPAIARFLQGG